MIFIYFFWLIVVARVRVWIFRSGSRGDLTCGVGSEEPLARRASGCDLSPRVTRRPSCPGTLACRASGREAAPLEVNAGPGVPAVISLRGAL